MKSFIYLMYFARQMEDKIMDEIIVASDKLMLWAQQFRKKRYLFENIIKTHKEYFVGIKGLRGVGKTVLMLQLAKEMKNSIYFSADAVFLKPYSLYEVSKELIQRGFTTIFIDEIHRKPQWDADIKTLYDQHICQIFFSGSSALNLATTSSDLSRRVLLKELRIISFREYLNLQKGFEFPALTFEKIMKERSSLARTYADGYGFFNEYLRYGGVLYPKNGFWEAMENSLKKIVIQDLSSLRDINVKYETDVYKLLYLVARSPPFEVNYSSIARELEVSKTMAIRMVHDLVRTGVLITIFPCARKGINARKEPKIYLTIPFREFIARQGAEINRGASREEFFVNHLPEVCYIKGKRGEKTPDFRFSSTTIEVGGASKTAEQAPDYIAIDSLSASGNRVPLFLFGFLY